MRVFYCLIVICFSYKKEICEKSFFFFLPDCFFFLHATYVIHFFLLFFFTFSFSLQVLQFRKAILKKNLRTFLFFLKSCTFFSSKFLFCSVQNLQFQTPTSIYKKKMIELKANFFFFPTPE